VSEQALPAGPTAAVSGPALPAPTRTPKPPKVRRRPTASLFEPSILRRAVGAALVKLDPRKMIHIPVMFVVEIGSVITSIEFVVRPDLFVGLVTLWLWATVLFANFAEAVAEGRGQAQADTLRRSRQETTAHLLKPDGSTEEIPSTQLRAGNLCVVTAGQVIPGDGDVADGMAVVDESAITGESAPVIRESGGDRSAVTGGTVVLSDRIVVRITSDPGETFLDRMIALVEGASRQKTPNEVALDILIAGLTLILLVAVVTLQPMAIYDKAIQSTAVLVALFVCLAPTTIGGLLSASASPAWTGWCSGTCWPCPDGPSRPPVTAPRSCSTRPARSPTGTGWPPGSCRSQASPRRNWPRRRCCRAWPTRRPRVVRSSNSRRTGTSSLPRI